MSDLMDALTELREARPAYEKAWDYYEGDEPERFHSALMAKLFGGTETYNFNFASRPVEAVLDRLSITAITCEPEDASELLQDRVWIPNRLDLESPGAHKKGLAYGDAYLFVWDSEPDDEDDEGPEAEGGTADGSAGPGVDVFVNSPLIARIIYDEENPRRKKLAIKSWCVGKGPGERIRVTLYYRDHLEKYISKAGSKGDKDEDFEPFVDDSTDENGIMPNPHGRVPFFALSTDSPYGRPEHKNAFGPQDAINKFVTNLTSSSDFSALPQRYGLIESGATTDDDLDWEHDDTTNPEDKDSALVSKPGSLWALKNYKSVGQFESSDPDNFLKPIGFAIRAMAATTSTPMRWFDPSGDVPSGESIRADEAPLNKKIKARSDSFGATWSEALSFALKILGRPGVKVTVRWENPQTVQDLEFWDMVLAKQDAGVPIRQTLLESGYSEVLCDKWGFTEDQPDGDPGFEEQIRLARAGAGGGAP